MTDNTMKSANFALQQYKYEQALAIFQQILMDNPKDALACQGISQALYGLKRYKEAIQVSLQSLELNTNLAVPHTVLAYSYYSLGEKDKGKNEAELALAIDPTSADALCCMGIFSLLDKKENDAQKYLEEAVKIKPEHYLAQYNLAVAYQNTNNKKLFKQTIILFKMKPGVNYFLKLIYVSSRNHRVYYGLSILLSAVIGLFTIPEILLVIGALLMLIYLVSGIYAAFIINRKQWGVFISNLISSILFGLVSSIWYFIIKFLHEVLRLYISTLHP